MTNEDSVHSGPSRQKTRPITSGTQAMESNVDRRYSYSEPEASPRLPTLCWLDAPARRARHFPMHLRMRQLLPPSLLPSAVYCGIFTAQQVRSTGRRLRISGKSSAAQLRPRRLAALQGREHGDAPDHWYRISLTRLLVGRSAQPMCEKTSLSVLVGEFG